MVSYLTPRTEPTFTGASMTGTDGAKNRTHTLIYDNPLSGSYLLIMNGSSLTNGTHYSISSGVLTVYVPVFNWMELSLSYDTDDLASSVLAYSSILGLVKYLNILKTVPSNERTSSPNTTNDLEEVGTGDGSTTRFFLANLGVIPGTYTLYYGATSSSVTALTETTHYTFDSDTSEITITATGLTTISTNKIFAKYYYNKEGIMSSELQQVLKAAENKIQRETDQWFAEYTDDDPDYRQVVNELILGSDNMVRIRESDVVYETYFQPLVNLSTTLASAYTTGGTSMTLTSATGFPSSGTIYVGGEKVSYTGKSGNVLTVPSTTASIASGATVSGFVVEISREPEGSDPSFTVLTLDTDYKIDYFLGKLRILDNAFFGELSAEDIEFRTNLLVRISYMNAWYQPGSNPSVPDEIAELTYMIAAKKLSQRALRRSQIDDQENVNLVGHGVTDSEVARILEYYKTLNVGSSPYNSQYLG